LARCLSRFACPEDIAKNRMILAKEDFRTKSGSTLRTETRVSGEHEVEIALMLERAGPCVLHWGCVHPGGSGWHVPPQSVWPEGSKPFGNSAVQTPFRDGNGKSSLNLRLNVNDLHRSSIAFVLFYPEEQRWDNNHGRNYRLNLSGLAPVSAVTEGSTGHPARPEARRPEARDLSEVIQKIVDAETTPHSWTLMHRFNLCHDLLGQVAGNREGLALLFVWLRFSAIRQLDWQRNYNTKPRELSHSMERLSNRITDLYFSGVGDPFVLRLLLSTLGRGAEGQRIRDEILEIMHRHHLKEVSGTFIEEWHQKMHNNTTPDDIVICEAYLDFLRADGNLDVFYSTLQAGGVSRKRLESYERPLRTPPDFVPYLKDALIHDFSHFRETLKAVHAGVDFEVSVRAAEGSVDGELRSLLWSIYSHRNDLRRSLTERAGTIGEARRRLAAVMNGGRRTRDLVLLDLSLEGLLRGLLEANVHLPMELDELEVLIDVAVENMLLSQWDDEVHHILRHWRSLEQRQPCDADTVLQTVAVLDRLEHALGARADGLARLLQPKAERLGSAFRAEPWTITLFSEEVARSTLAPVLAILTRKAHLTLRRSASLGTWRVLSAGRASGRVELLDALESVHTKSLREPAVILARTLTGNEDIAPAVTAVLSAEGVDVLSHVAIRARNHGVVFAACYDPDEFAQLGRIQGCDVTVDVEPSGHVAVREGATARALPQDTPRPVVSSGVEPCSTARVIPASDFREGIVGAKALNIFRLRERLPAHIHLPRTLGIPFGVCERVLEDERNRQRAQRYAELQEPSDTEPCRRLAALRDVLCDLEAPDAFLDSLRRILEEEGMPVSHSLDDAWSCIKRVWASKWTERAHLSREANGIPHKAVFMSVLLQQVVQADYAFVIHTANPLTGRQDEIYAEVVGGLGETLTGSYPGAALAFTSAKEQIEPRVLCWPSKSVGLYGSGLIFRSDSSAEDLPGYAAAGLYESVMLDPPRSVPLDYLSLPLLQNRQFRQEFLTSIVTIGTVVERLQGEPQDIEGAFADGLYYLTQTRPQVGFRS
jgi:alpha-glucan, water dikinase